MHWAIVTVYFHAFGGGYPARRKLGVTPGQSGMGEGGGGQEVRPHKVPL